MQLKLTVAVTDPVTGSTQVLARLFDSTTATQGKWNGLFPEVAAMAQLIVQTAKPPADL